MSTLLTEDDLSIKFGKFLADPPPGEEVVITGISGRFPESANVHQLRDNLFNKIDMISDDTRRWNPIHPEIPQRTGKLLELNKFDSGYFGMEPKQCDEADPMLRIALEVTAEAMFDAGYQPADFENTKTGVFVGISFYESILVSHIVNQLKPGTKIFTGAVKPMSANRLSYFFKLNGPSLTLDSACSSSVNAMDLAYVAIRKGQCEKAIVAGAHLCLHPHVALQFSRMGILNPDGKCRSLDADAKGYVRSEAICAVILEKAKHAKRIYATVIHCKNTSYGFTQEGISHPLEPQLIKLYKELYTECGVDPKLLSYFEPHSTGTSVGDSIEGKAIANVFIKSRQTPLLVGSVKSNLGHVEPASGLVSIIKVILSYETGYIPPNLHFNTLHPDIQAVTDGKFQVVTEKTPFEDDMGLIGVNNSGFGGTSGHILLKWNTKKKILNNSLDNIPRLICVSGRTNDAVNTLLDDILANNLDAEHIRLLQNVFRKTVSGHLYRGFLLATRNCELKRSVRVYSHQKSPVYIAFGKVNKSLISLGKELSKIPEFDNYLKNMQMALHEDGASLSSFEYAESNQTFFGMAIQVSLIELFKKLGIKIETIFGQSIGELVSAYYDGDLTLKETMYCAYLINHSLKHGSFGKNQEELTKIISDKGIFIVRRIISALDSNTTNNLKLLNFTSKCIILEFGNPIPELQKYKANTLSNNTNQNKLNNFLESIGSLYERGHDVQQQKLFPKVDFPVSRGTPMISPKIKWSHRNNFFVVDYKNGTQTVNEQVNYNISLADESWSYLKEHVVDGRNFFPCTGYLYLVWETFAKMKSMLPLNMSVRFENVNLKRVCLLPKQDDEYLHLTVAIQNISNKFEVLEHDVTLASGTIKYMENSLCDGHLSFMGNEVKEEISLDNKNFYKEMRLKGHTHQGLFKGISDLSLSGTSGTIKWQDNFVVFLDSMLQVLGFNQDTRETYVPLRIKSVNIDAPAHLMYVKKLQNQKKLNNISEIDTLVPVTLYRDINLVKSGGLEVFGADFTMIARKKSKGKPILEKYQFIPNEFNLNLPNAIRVVLQIIFENTGITRNRIVDIIDETTVPQEPLSILIKSTFEDEPLVLPDMKILSTKHFDIDIEVKDTIIEEEKDCDLVIGSNLLSRRVYISGFRNFYLNILDRGRQPNNQWRKNTVKSNGYIISREPLSLDLNNSMDVVEAAVVGVYTTDNEKIILLKKQEKNVLPPTLVHISMKDKHLKWLKKLQDALKNSENVIVYSQDEPLSGVIGLMKCLRKEPGNNHVTCFVILDQAPLFDPKNEFYSKQLQKNLAYNVYKNGMWGTYRHLSLDELENVEAEHCMLNCTSGDLSTLKWYEEPLKHMHTDCETSLVNVYFSSINFKDIMIAAGKINADVFTKNRTDINKILGMEFSGRILKTGKRVMGVVKQGAFSTLVKADDYMLWDVPDLWTLEEAATVPIVYLTCIYALFQIAKIKNTDSILIHSATGGIGQAAINLCLNLGCNIFVTVGTSDKREFIKKCYPKLKDSHIGNSRDASFEKMIKSHTNGRGVDIVLNSLSEEKLLASLRCTAPGGRFVEIGKYDSFHDSSIRLSLLNNGISFNGVSIDKFCDEPPEMKKVIYDKLKQFIDIGFVKPLVRTVFPSHDVEKAFRFMGAGHHIGKVLIKIRDEEKGRVYKAKIQKFICVPRFYCTKDKSYIICGGLGGFGLELADWLILRGAKHLLLSSRHGITTGYQKYRIKLWRSYGCNVKISTSNISTVQGCETLIKEALELGPVSGIFNLTLVLEDAVLENQTKESFMKPMDGKVYATKYLDALSRILCPHLEDFVVFSSIICGRGLAGQTNYGMANSIMERICEKRQQDGFPALAIQWGVIGDIGQVVETKEVNGEIEVAGCMKQSMANCLQLMDIFLKQDNCIVGSMIIAGKIVNDTNSVMKFLGNILGIRDFKSVSMAVTLAELGMDSISAVEIKQLLERKFDRMLTAEEVRTMTIARIKELEVGKAAA